jgi:hypothetical protein
VSFHVEVRRSFHRARVFNLSEEQVRRRVLEPWSRGAPVELGDREWRPADSKLTVLEGQRLDTAELALGQGWNNATKVAEDVTTRLLAGAGSSPAAAGQATAVAVLADRSATASAIVSLLGDLGLRPLEWEPVQARILAGGGAGVAAAVVVLDRPLTPQLGLAVGLAVGALGNATVLVRLGSAPVPAELAHLAHVTAEPGGQAWVHSLAERLRVAGCTLQPRPGWDTPERLAGV